MCVEVEVVVEDDWVGRLRLVAGTLRWSSDELEFLCLLDCLLDPDSVGLLTLSLALLPPVFEELLVPLPLALIGAAKMSSISLLFVFVPIALEGLLAEAADLLDFAILLRSTGWVVVTVSLLCRVLCGWLIVVLAVVKEVFGQEEVSSPPQKKVYFSLGKNSSSEVGHTTTQHHLAHLSLRLAWMCNAARQSIVFSPKRGLFEMSVWTAKGLGDVDGETVLVGVSRQLFGGVPHLLVDGYFESLEPSWASFPAVL